MNNWKSYKPCKKSIEFSWRFFATHSHDIYFLRYSKLEFEQARNLWMAGVRHLGETASEAEYETQFSVLVEQEVEKRLFQVSRLCIQHTLCQIIIFLSNFWKNFQSSEFYFLNTIWQKKFNLEWQKRNTIFEFLP